MRYLVCALLLVPILGVSSAIAEDSERLQGLLTAQKYYEGMLRDSQTETAAKYFLGKLADLAVQIDDCRNPPEARGAQVAPLTLHADRWVRARIRLKVQEEHLGLSDATAWTRRELPEALFGDHATWLGMEKVRTPEEALKAWEKRPRRGWLTASFGSGTFIIRPTKPGPKPPRRGGRSSPGSDIVIPKPPTRDGWWKKASTTERTEWAMAFFVQNSGLFEVADKPIEKMCPECKGEGRIGQALCPRCAGTRVEATIRYR